MTISDCARKPRVRRKNPRFYYRGKPETEMTRDELLDIIDKLLELQGARDRVLCVEREIRNALRMRKVRPRRDEDPS